jgi:hypothetical protein
MFARARWIRAATAAAIALVVGGAALVAQDLNPEDLFQSAKSAYDAKKYGKALSELQLLVGEISKLRVEQLKAVLPAAPAGWTAGEPSGESAGGMIVMGAGITVKRSYTKDQKSVSLELVSDSPMVGMFAPLLSNPALLQGDSNTSVVSLKGGRRAILEYHAASKQGSVKILLRNNTTLLTLEGNQVEKSDLLDAFAKGMDIDAIEKALQD